MKQDATPLGAVLERLESILEPASRWATLAHSIEQALENPDHVSAILAREFGIRDAISQSCRAWIDTGNLPVMDDDEAKYFCDRLKCGETMIRWLRSGGLRCDGKTPNEVLTWLLVESWESVCFPLWKNELQD